MLLLPALVKVTSRLARIIHEPLSATPRIGEFVTEPGAVATRTPLQLDRLWKTK